MLKPVLQLLLLSLLTLPLTAQTADEIISKYIKTVGGMENIQAVKTIRRTGKFIGGGGFEAQTVDENSRPNMVRQEFAFQGLTGITAYFGLLEIGRPRAGETVVVSGAAGVGP